MRSASSLLLLFLLCGCTQKERIATAVTRLGESPSKFILYSLDPNRREADESPQATATFRGWDILGQAEISDPDEQRALVRALARGVRESESAALCFEPRHGLHIEQRGRTTDFTICFACSQVFAHGFEVGGGFVTSRSPQPTFDESLRRHQLPLASK